MKKILQRIKWLKSISDYYETKEKIKYYRMGWENAEKNKKRTGQ